MESSAAPTLAAAAPRWRPWRRLTPARARLWAVLGIHLAAFAVLYLGAFGLLERAFSEAGATALRYQLDEAVRRMPFLWMGDEPHVLPHRFTAPELSGLHLYRRDGTLAHAGMLSDPAEVAMVRDFLAGDEVATSAVRNEQGRQWARGVVRIRAGESCLPCHTSGATLGAAALRLDFSAPLAEIRDRLRDRTALLLGVWIALLGGVSLVVQRTVDRAGARLRADLAAAAIGDAAAAPASDSLPLDPVTAEVHRHLRELLRSQRERESRVASQLAHVDQLASLGQLAAGLAHEIKNPLAGIQGALELLRDDSRDGETTRLYGEMLTELGRVDGILRRLLESARPAPLRCARTDVGRLLAETADLLRPSLRRRRVELRAESPAGLPEVRLDAAKLRQVLVNLIQNAAEAMPESGGHVVVRTSAFPDPPALVVAVEDDGPGIASENLARLFEPFFTTKFSGTGLGLAISKSIVEQHGGRIEVSSSPGRGTTFLLVLPLGGEGEPPTGPANAAEGG
jgi:signal transduction histidine kinase